MTVTLTKRTNLVDDHTAEDYNLLIDAIQQLPGPNGFMLNGKISVSVASNNLTIAIKTLAGSDPSTSDPVAVRIGDTVQLITAALSITINAGANTFNAGAASFLGQQIEYPTYLGFRAASSTVFLATGRPFGRTYADFSATATDERYLKYSGSAPASSDIVELIGSFKAANSGSASYNWSISGTGDVKNHPIIATDFLTLNPQLANVTVGNGTLIGRYKLLRSREVDFEVELTFGSTTSISGDPSLTHILAPSLLGSTNAIGLARYNLGATQYSGVTLLNSTAIYNRCQAISGTYLAQAVPSSSAPGSWAATHVMNIRGRYAA